MHFSINCLPRPLPRISECVATDEITKRGTGIIGSKYLKPLGDHLFQLRIKEYADDQQIKFLIRIYLCFDFKHGVHILSGYNKGRDDSRERQSLEIEKARQLLWKWMESNEAL